MLTFEETYSKYWRFVCSIIHKHLPHEQPDDIANAVFLKLHERLGDIQNETALRQWLNVSTTRACINKLNVIRREKRNSHAYIAEEINKNECELIEDFDRRQIKNHVLETIVAEVNKLHPKTRRAFCLFYFKRLSIKQIGDSMNITKATVNSHLDKARKQLRMNILFKKLRQD